jgi:PAS domain S-box-containing protein
VIKAKGKINRQPLKELSGPRRHVTEPELAERSRRYRKISTAVNRLRDPEDSFRTAIENSNDGVAIMKGDRHVYVNQKFLEMFGYEKTEEVIGKTHHLTVHPGDRNMVTDFNRKRQRNETAPAKYEFKGIRKDGSTIYLEASVAAITYLGEPASLAYLRDVTERKKTDALLRASEERYRNLIENALVGVYQTNLKGDILYINETCLHLFGFETPEEAASEGSPGRYRNQEDRKTVIEILKKKGNLSNFELEFITKTGDPLIVLLSATLESEVITGMIMDITEHKRADEALRKSENLYRLLAENVIDVIWTMDMNLNFTYISPSIARFRGITADQALHQSLRDVLTPRSCDIVLGVLQEELAKGTTGQEDLFRSRVLELEHIRQDGSIGWAEVKVSFLRDASGRPNGILGVTRDITHRKEADRELRMKSHNLEEVNTALKVLLEQREKDKNDLEDKILFNVKKLVLPYVDALKERRLDEEQRTYLDVLETNLKNIISPFAKKLTSIHENFTPLEIKVADFIRDGKTVKEIAKTFGVSESAINLHRQHIRNKLGLNNQKINLRTYLLSLT